MNSKTKVFKLKTINEMRKENELKPIEGGDIIPIHHVSFTNLKYAKEQLENFIKEIK